MKLSVKVDICQRIDSIGVVVTKEYKENPLKPPNIVESKEVLSTKPALKPPPNPCCYTFLEKSFATKKLNCNLKATSAKSL